MAVVLSTHRLHACADELLRDHCELRIASGLDEATLTREAADAHVIIVRAPIPEAAITAATRLKALIRHGAGLDMIPLAHATKRGMLVANVPGANARSVAEHVLMTSLMLGRGHRASDMTLRRGGWAEARAAAEKGRQLPGSIGLVGYGSVGQAIAEIFGSLGLRVRAYSPTGRAPEPIRARLEEVIGECDIVVLCCPLNAQTQGMMNASRIETMRRDAILVNVSRGGLVDDDALLRALLEGRIAGAVLDVFNQQPLPSYHPYYGMANVVLTPHVAGLSEESMQAMSLGAAREALRVLNDELPINLVNREAVPEYRRRQPCL